jgi:dTDP-4-amino-4,6-dideoxygalactose transaminase
LVRSKQIIYPIRYFRGALGAEARGADEFESRLSTFLGGDVHTIAVGRARAGLYLLAKLAVSGRRNRIILSPHTIPDVVNMLRFAQAEPVFFDHLPRSTHIDLDHLATLVDDTTCAVIVTHYHVNQAQMVELRGLCAAKSVLLFDDCAIALGATDGDTRIGSTTDASVFSLSGFKALNALWGGAITTRSPELAKRIRAEVRQWPELSAGQYWEQFFKVFKYDVMTRYWNFSALTFPLLKHKALKGNDKEVLPMVRVETTSLDRTICSRPATWVFAEWNRKFDTIDPFIVHRRKIAALYDRALGDEMVSPETPADVRARSAFVNYPVWVDPARRTQVFKKIMHEGFDVGLSLYPNVHEMKGFDQIKGRSENVCRLIRSVISLPTHIKISEDYAVRLGAVARNAIASNDLAA